MKIRFLLFLVIVTVKPLFIFSQGLFQVKVYEPETHRYFRHNWSALQDSSGILFFGNSTGLQIFDGVQWHPVKHVPKGSAILSLTKKGNTIYWGGNGDFGIIGSDSLNQFIPHSNRSSVDSSYQNFSYLWYIIEHQGKIYHQNSRGIYVLKDDSVYVLGPEERFKGLFKLGNDILIQRENEELSYLRDDKFIPAPRADFFNGDVIYEILSISDYYLFFSRKKGIVRFDGESFVPLITDASEYIIRNRVYRGTHINGSEIALATLDGGIVIINHDGEIRQIIREEDGLPTNTIYNVYLDHEETLWVTTDYGVAKILINNPLRILNEVSGLKGNPLFITSYNNQIYSGTTEGLFNIDNNGEMTQNESFIGRVYDGLVKNGELILSTVNGLFRLIDDSVEQLSDESYLDIIRDYNEANLLFGISGQGIDRLHFQNNQIEIENFLEADFEIQHAFKDHQRFWVLLANNTVQVFNLNGIRMSLYEIPIAEESRVNKIGMLAGKLRVATGEGLFLFDETADRFITDTTFNNLELINEEVLQFQQCSENEIWFRNHRKIKRAVRENGVWRTITNPYRTIARDLDEGVEDIHCDEDGSVWFGASRNLYHLSDPDWTYNHNFNTNITGVLVQNDSLIYGGYGDPAEIKDLKFEENELRFTYAAASYIDPEANEYRTRLRGYEEQWSGWSAEPQKDYTFIPEGTYTFEVQGRNVYHKTGSIDSYTFSILPPWYRTIWAYFGYLCLACGVVYAGHKIRLNSILKEQRIRDGIARDLHDELSSTLSSISFFANAMDSHKRKVEKENRYLSLIKKSSQEAKEKISDIVWVIHTENDDWENLLMRCKRFASDILDARDIQHNFEIKGSFTGKPNINQKKNIWLIFREILTNIARHADPNQVDIRFSENGGKLHIHIEDNGKGFDPENTREGGYGVQNIKERAHQMKAACTLESMPGEGTRWVIDVPVG